MKVVGIRSGRKWAVDGLASASTDTDEGPITSLTEEYLIEREKSEIAWTAADINAWSYQQLNAVTTGIKLPKIGDAHNGDTTNSLLRVTGISFAEGTGADKLYVVATVSYTRIAQAGEGTSTTPGCYCESWGWSNGSVSRDLTAADGGPILNSAEDPYDSVPQIDIPSPVFHKVFKTASRYPDILSYHNKVNKTAVTISGVEFAAGTLRIVQAEEERIFGDAGFKYRYSIGLQYMTNTMDEVCVYKTDSTGAYSWTKQTDYECGWNAVVVDTGLREKAVGSTEATRIMDTDENGNLVPVSIPVPLNGFGIRSTEGAVLRMYQTYAPIDVPAIFYSEPA